MGMEVECPKCGNVFHVHGWEGATNCYRCNKRFNPQTNPRTLNPEEEV